MKRFLIDGILVLILVAVGTSLMEKEKVENIDVRIEDFEDGILDEDIYVPPVYDSVQEHHVNKAALLAQKSGDVIEEVVSVGVEMVASLFKAFVE